MAQVKVPGSRSLAVTEPSPPGPVEPEATMVPLASTQPIVDAVPPSICELTNVVMSGQRRVVKLTVSPTYGLSVQLAALSTATCLSLPSTW
jgi:hypothetical protein